MPQRYSFIVADRTSGEVHQFTIRVRLAAVIIAAIFALPVGWAFNTHRMARAEIDQLKLQTARAEIENSSFRAASNQLVAQISALKAVTTNLAGRSKFDPMIRRSFDRLPSSLHSQNRTGPTNQPAGVFSQHQNLDLLSDLLTTLDTRLQIIRHGVARREALAEAIPIIWPADGWISGNYGYRNDPFTGVRGFHRAVDISTHRGQPVYATAAGRIASAAHSGNYGNLVKIDHGFELSTRYGHLSRFAVGVGDTVRRGDIIGYAGATGRATGYHVHYEVWVNGRTLNPLRLLAESQLNSAN
jgi:murein DD-endopeptidase MepM/ murein hydrolase activator NlpD